MEMDSDRTPLLVNAQEEEETLIESRPANYGSDGEAEDVKSSGSGAEEYHRRPEEKVTCFVYVLTALAAIGGFLFGYDTGVVSGAMLLLTKEFQLTSLWVELVVSITVAAAAIFSFLGGFVNQRFGRKPTIIIASFVFTIGAIILGTAKNREMLLIGRFILGIGIGFASMTVPVYIAESAPPHMRGRLVTVNNLFITGGQCIAGIIDGLFSNVDDGWRYMLGLAAVPAVIQFVGFLFMPESPRWLISRRQDDKARLILRSMRGTDDVDQELQEIKQSVDEAEKLNIKTGGSSVIALMFRTPHVRRALFVGCMLQLFQQITGINTVMYYSATIIKMSGVKDPSIAIWLAAATAAVNFLFTIVGLWLVERVGRRPLVLGSLLGTVFSLACLAISFQVAAYEAPPVTAWESSPVNYTGYNKCLNYTSCNSCALDTSCGFCYQPVQSSASNGSCVPAWVDSSGQMYDNASYGQCGNPQINPSMMSTPLHYEWAYDYCPTGISWLSTLAMVLYLAFFAPGMGPMPWTINSEIYPLWARSAGNSISTATNWVFNLIIAMTFLTLTEELTRYGAFWLYTCFGVVGWILMYFILPETKGKTLEEVETLFKKPWC